MFRVSSVRRSHHGYDLLGVDSSSSAELVPLDPKLTRARSVPARILYGLSKKPIQEVESRPQAPEKGSLKSSSSSKKGNRRIHPLLSLFDRRWRRKKTTAKPEFARYLEYVKEGGVWDDDTGMPVIYYK